MSIDIHIYLRKYGGMLTYINTRMRAYIELCACAHVPVRVCECGCVCVCMFGYVCKGPCVGVCLWAHAIPAAPLRNRYPLEYPRNTP